VHFKNHSRFTCSTSTTITCQSSLRSSPQPFFYPMRTIFDLATKNSHDCLAHVNNGCPFNFGGLRALAPNSQNGRKIFWHFSKNTLCSSKFCAILKSLPNTVIRFNGRGMRARTWPENSLKTGSKSVHIAQLRRPIWLQIRVI
jgi:hypothetical protein